MAIMEKSQLDAGGNEVSTAVDKPIVSVENLSVEFVTDHGWQRVLNDVSLQVLPGKVLGVVGESGSGKSVSSLAIMGLLPKSGARVSSGSIEVDGIDMLGMGERELSRVRGERISMIFQEPMSSSIQRSRSGSRSPKRFVGTRSWVARQPGNGRSRHSTRWGFPTPPIGSTATRTNSPAACASGR